MVKALKNVRPTLYRRFGPFVLAGVLLHLLAIEAVSLLPEREQIRVPKHKRIILTQLPSNVSQSKRALDPQKDVEKAEDKEKKEDIKGQVVSLPPSSNSEAPENAEFLAQTDNKTERETRSRHARQHYKNAMNELTHTKPSTNKVDGPTPPVVVEQAGKTKSDTPGSSEGRFSLPKLQMRDTLQLERDSELGSLFNQSGAEEVPKSGTGDVLSLGLGKGLGHGRGALGSGDSVDLPQILMPTLGTLARLAGAPANDELKDVEEGEGTFLNTRRFKYASFFNRVSKGVSQTWNPRPEIMRRDPSGRVFGRIDRVTVLSITLDKAGTLQEVDITRSSGLPFLDREAIMAVKRAQPFPNPPKGMVNAREEIIFPFGFSHHF